MSDAASSSGRSTEILIVDDDGTVCRSIEKVLNRAGYKTRTCLSVSAALETVQAKPEFDLIITDLMMPRANGVELLKIAKATWPKIPVLVITGYASLASAVEATQLGAAHYLAKPFTPDELLAAVERAFAPQPFTETMSAPAVAQQDGEPAESIELEPNGPDDLTGA
ncbi:MAG: response regulator, partial [Acidobacteria bacterium]